jgi:hypothetical protein
MIQLNKSNNSESILVTLNESSTITTGYYLFVFTHTTTKAIVNKIFALTDDISSYKSRFNEFLINTSSVFASAKVGQYQYQVYQQASSSNTDITGLTMIECGKMVLTQTESAIYATDAQTTAYKTYDN